MSSILYITVILGFAVLTGLIIWLLSFLFLEKKEPQDSPIDLNFLSNKFDGYFIGVETSSVGAKDGRHFIKMLPKDVDIKMKDKDLKEVSVIVDKNKVCSLPKGTVSKYKNINILLPKHASDLHEALKETIVGRGLMMGIELQNAANAEIDSLLMGHDRKDEILSRIGHAEVSKEFLNFQEELYKDALKFNLEAKSRDKSPTSLSSSTPFLPPRKD